MKKCKYLLAFVLAFVLICAFASCGDKVYNVSFDNCGDTPIASVFVNEGETVAEPEVPIKSGNDFLGWYNGDELYDFSSPVTSDIKLSAHWAPTVNTALLAGNWKGIEKVGNDEYQYYLTFSGEGVLSLRITLNGTDIHLIGVKSFSDKGRLGISFNHGGLNNLYFTVSDSLTGKGMADGNLTLKRYEDVHVTYHYASGKKETVTVDKGTLIRIPESQDSDLVPDGWYDISGALYTGDESVTADIDIYEAAYTEGLTIADGRVVGYSGNSVDVIIPPFCSGKAVSVISDSAFADTKIESVILPFTMKAIERESFRNCTSLVGIKLDGVEAIGEKAFYNCNSFISLKIPKSVKSIGFGAFASDMQISVREEVTMLIPAGAQLEDITFESILGDGGENSFLSYIFGAETPEYMNYYDEPTTVKVNGEEKLVDLIYCLPTSLKRIYLDIGDTIPDKAFYNCFYIERISIRSDVKTVGNSAFDGCYMANIEGLDAVERVGDRAFFASAFDGERMPNLSYIGDMAFANTLIADIVLSKQLTHIGSSAFAYTAISKITIPDSVEYIGDTAFFGCNNLQNVYFLSDKPCDIGATLFTKADSEGTIYYSDALIWVPMGGSYAEYRSDINLRDYAASVFPSNYEGREGYIVDGTSLIGYIGDERLVTLTVPTGVTEIADYSFYNRRDIEDVVMPGGFLRIGRYAFYNCTSVQNLIFPSSIEEIDDYAFTGFFVGNNISRLYFPEGFRRIGDGAFMSSFNLKIIELPSTLESIGYLAFGMSNSLESISFESELPPTVGTYENNQEVLTEIFSIINPGKTVIYVPYGRVNGKLISDIYKSTPGFSAYEDYIKSKPEGDEVGHYGNGSIFIDLDGCDGVVISTISECETDTSDNGGTRYELIEKRGSYVLLGAVLKMTFEDEEITAIYSNRTINMTYGSENIRLAEPKYYYDSYNWTNFRLYESEQGRGNGLFDMYGSFLTPFEWSISGTEISIWIDGNNKLPEHADYAGVVEYKGSYDTIADSFSVSFMLNDYDEVMNFRCERNNVIYASGEVIRFIGTYKCFAEQNPDYAMFTLVSYGNGKVDVYIGDQVYEDCTYTMENGVITIDFQTLTLTFQMDANGRLDGDFLGTACHFVYVDELMDSTKLPSSDEGAEQ